MRQDQHIVLLRQAIEAKMDREMRISSMLVVRMEIQQMLAASLTISETETDTQMAPSGMSDDDLIEELLFH